MLLIKCRRLEKGELSSSLTTFAKWAKIAQLIEGLPF